MTENIRQIPIEDLKEEIARREQTRPKLITTANINTDKLIAKCYGHIEMIDQFGKDTDAEHEIYEAAMVTFYGKSVWEWINENDKGEGYGKR